MLRQELIESPTGISRLVLVFVPASQVPFESLLRRPVRWFAGTEGQRRGTYRRIREWGILAIAKEEAEQAGKSHMPRESSDGSWLAVHGSPTGTGQSGGL